MRGRILEVPNLLDQTLLREPRRGVVILATSVKTDADGATEGATVEDSQDNARLVGCNSARGMGVLHQCGMAQRGVRWCERHKCVAPVQDGIERCATVQEAQVCCTSVGWHKEVCEMHGDVAVA